jgi:glutamine amidotransferase
MIAIVDTGGANHASIQNALARLGAESAVTLDREALNAASHLVLPGVGHAGFAMERLEKNGLIPFLRAQKKPVLGICLGMQILFSSSEEGDTRCLDLIPGRVSKLKATADFRVPHMGWSLVQRKGNGGVLLNGIAESSYFYFVHSFQVPASDCTTAQTPEGIPAVIEHGNFLATQFHPERSGEAGARLLGNFLEWRGV